MMFEMRGDHGRPRSLLDESLTLIRERADTRGLAWILFFLGTLAYAEGNVRQASCGRRA